MKIFWMTEDHPVISDGLQEPERMCHHIGITLPRTPADIKKHVLKSKRVQYVLEKVSMLF